MRAHTPSADQPGRPPATAACPPDTGSRHVFLVDDTASVLKVLQNMLEEGGHRVTTATTGEEGLSCLREGRVNALVTDMILPGLSGLDLIRRARQMGFPHPIVVVTGWPQLPPEVTLVADSVLAKPVTIEALNRSLALPAGTPVGTAEEGAAR